MDGQDENPIEGSVMVVIKNHSFNPLELEVKQWTKVVWFNEDTDPHTIVSDPNGGDFRSEILLPKVGNFSYMFNEPGEYPYHCGIHPEMMGKIVVREVRGGE